MKPGKSTLSQTRKPLVRYDRFSQTSEEAKNDEQKTDATRAKILQLVEKL